MPKPAPKAGDPSMCVKVTIPSDFPLGAHLKSLADRSRARHLLLYANLGFHLSQAGLTPDQLLSVSAGLQPAASPAGPLPVDRLDPSSARGGSSSGGDDVLVNRLPPNVAPGLVADFLNL
jgi:hypothetical protein